MRYGGNTSCLEVMAGGHRLVFDAGTGIRKLGNQICGAGGTTETEIFFTHTHFDHIAGLSFFAPLARKGHKVRLSAGHLAPDLTLKQVVRHAMAAPLYPVTMDIFAAEIEFRDFVCGDTLKPAPGVTIRTVPLNHPNGATGYRIEHAGKSICYITDTEHRPGERDANIVDLCRGADIMVYDSSYTDEEYPRHVGWGHSTWQEGMRIADAADIATLAIFHHDPSHDDDTMDRIVAEAAAARPGMTRAGLPRIVAAREGMTLAP
ncbi:MAG: MBL fold metallo-hydrolase [Alphaproteobacteria bacterium]|nr:MBL fold metallo-hydrolase [Alphaproteobacteria bacterium]MCW5741098.1 MBL fold metallo-hydrolase [Alphaproteobacteria bacterium]